MLSTVADAPAASKSWPGLSRSLLRRRQIAILGVAAGASVIGGASSMAPAPIVFGLTAAIGGWPVALLLDPVVLVVGLLIVRAFADASSKSSLLSVGT